MDRIAKSSKCVEMYEKTEEYEHLLLQASSNVRFWYLLSGRFRIAESFVQFYWALNEYEKLF
jgi:hypothetical protein